MATVFSYEQRSSDFDCELSKLLPKLRHFAQSLSRNGSDADDLTQAALERGLRARSQWRPGTRLDSWLFRIMRNQWIDTVRSRQRCSRVEVPSEQCATIGEDPIPALEAFVQCHDVLAAIEELPAEHCEVLKHVVIDGCGYAETAQKLQLPIGTVASRVVRARAALIAAIEAPRPKSSTSRTQATGLVHVAARKHIRRIVRRA